MKKLRRLLMDPLTEEVKMTTLYEYHAKVGTYGSTIIWLLEPAEKGKQISGICAESRLSPYMEGHAFRYAPLISFMIDDVQYWEEGYEFVFAS